MSEPSKADKLPEMARSGWFRDESSAVSRGRQEVIAQAIFRIVSLITAGLVLVVGIIIVSGTLIPAYVPANYRLILGVVMMLYGLYRILMIWMKHRNARKLQ